MDEVNLEEVFLSQTPMLRSCPGFLRGLFRHSHCTVLRERYRAKLVGDTVGGLEVVRLCPGNVAPQTNRLRKRGKEELVERAIKAKGSGEIFWQACGRHQTIHIPRKRRTSSQNRNDEVVPRAIVCSKGKCLEPGRSLLEPHWPQKSSETLAELPPDLDDVWDPEGIKILGTPIGSEDFVQRALDRRLEDEAKLWDALTWVPTCAGPPSEDIAPSTQCARRRNAASNGRSAGWSDRWGGREGGGTSSGIPSKAFGRPGVEVRPPNGAGSILEGAVAVGGCLRELGEVADRFGRQRFVGRPVRAELKLGARPLPAHTVEPGDWANGWQYHAFSASECHFRETVVLPQSCFPPGPPAFSLRSAPRMPQKPRVHSGGRSVT